MPHLEIVMTTHTREPSYLAESLASFFETAPETSKLRLLIHEPIASDEMQRLIALYPDRITWRVLKPEETVHKLSLPSRVRVAHATRLALEWAGSECLLLQDDVKFAPGWYDVLSHHLEMLGPQRTWALISLFYPHASSGIGLQKWTPSTYWGLQAMYFGKIVRKTIITDALSTSGEKMMWPTERNSSAPGADARIKDLLVRRPDIPLYAVHPPLVDHTGLVTSIGAPVRPQNTSTFKQPRQPVRWPEGKG